MHESGAHYVAIQYANGKYNMCNENSNDTSFQPYDSIEGWLKDNKYTAISLVTLQK